MKTIGIVHSPYKEKFSIPRQANLIPIPMEIEILPPFNKAEAFKGLENFSHIIVLFLFHEILESEEKLTVRPPRLGGNTTQGVFATRSPYRPNRIGFSIVKLKTVSKNKLEIIGGDFLDQTPIIDIKPYLNYSDAVPDANSSWTDHLDEEKLEVFFECDNSFIDLEKINYIKQILANNPIPRFHQDLKKNYAVKLFDYDIHFQINNFQITVFEIKII